MSSDDVLTGHVSLTGHGSMDSLVNDDQDWLNIAFLPFNDYWERLVITSLVLNFLLCIHLTVFGADLDLLGEAMYYFCELIFLIDTITAVTHRKVQRISKTRYYRKRSKFIIAISVISLIPYGETYNILRDYSWEENLGKVSVYIRLKCVVRLTRILNYFFDKKEAVATSHLMIIVVQQTVYILIFSSLFSSFWFYMSCWKCASPNWSDRITSPAFDHKNILHWINICWFTVAATFAHSWPGYLTGITLYEKVFFIVCMILGFLLHSTFFFGQLTMEFLQLYRCFFEYKARMKKIVYLLNDWRVEPHIKSRTMEYYTVFWQQRHGIKNMPAAFHLLPMSLQKEITADIFWELLRHSHLLRDTEFSFKRAVTLVMKTNFLLPGDYLLKIGDQRTNMIYITSGMVTLLSEEDNESPIMSLSGGTLLGDIACLMSVKCCVNIRCETYCEIQTLGLRDLAKVLVDHQKVTRILLGQLRDRINYAKWAKSDKVPKLDLERNFWKEYTTIETLKIQWKRIFKLNRAKKVDESEWKRLNRCFTSDYLDTLVLSDNVELKLKVICLTSIFPFIKDPDSDFRRFLEYVDLVVVLLQVFIVPYTAVFLKNRNIGGYYHVSVILDLFYAIDVFVQLTTAVAVSNSKIITKFTHILLYRLNYMSFIVDVISCFPFRFVLTFLETSEHYYALFQVSRLLKFYKVFVIIAKNEQQLSVNYLYIRLIKYIVIAIVLIYWCASILYITACFNEECYKYSWYIYNHYWRSVKYVFHKLDRCMFYAASLVLNVNISDNSVYTVEDMCLIITVIYLGYVTYSFCFAELAASAISQMRSTYDYQEQISVFSTIMKKRGVNKELRTRLLNLFDFSFTYNEGAQIYGDEGILSEASAELKSEIINDRIIECLKLAPVFKECGDLLLKKFSLQTEVITLPSETVILNTNVMSNHVYVIIRGFCRMDSLLPGDAERKSVITLKRGDMLAPMETLHRLRMFGPIVSLTAVELLCITYSAFLDIFQSSRHEYLYFQTALSKHMELFETILLRKGCRLPPLRSTQKALGKIDTFEYQIESDDSYVILPPEYYYQRPFKELGIWSFVKHLLSLRTINPHSKFFVFVEVMRCTLGTVDVILSLISFVLSTRVTKTCTTILSVMRILCFVDLYVRLHCQYYTDDGILVTHPLLTASHYLKTSFLIDLLAIIPYSWIGFTHLFGRKNIKVVTVLVRIFLRPLHLHRLFNAISLIQSSKYGNANSLVLKSKIVIISLVVLGQISNIVTMLLCDTHGQSINCEGTAWIKHSYFSDTKSSVRLVFIDTLYFIFSIAAHSLCGAFSPRLPKEVRVFGMITFISFIFRTMLLATFISSGIRSDARIAEYQIHMKWFLQYARKYKIDEILVKKTVQHYTHVWKETLGTNIGDIANKFNINLRVQLDQSLYEETLKSTQILADAPTSVMQQFISCIEELNFTRGADIVRCNDIQDKSYFVYRGQVDISIANVVLATLSTGGVFGCFDKQGVTRQTITATAKTHATILAVDSKKLHQFLKEWDDKYTEANLRNIRLLNTEYMASGKTEPTLSDVSIVNAGRTRYDKFLINVNHYIHYDGKLFRAFEYILNVHLASISSIVIMANICAGNIKSRNHLGMSIFIYTVDVLFLLKIFLSLALYYTDTDTGLRVTNSKKIFLRYFKTDFVLHVVTNVPFELILDCFMDDYTKFGTINRILRILYCQRYFRYYSHELTLTTHLRLIHLTYWVIYEVQVIASIWFSIACFGKYCTKSLITRGNRPLRITPTTSALESTVYGYSYVINLLTNSGFRDVIPTSSLEMIISMAIAVMGQSIAVTLSTGYTNIMMIQFNPMFNFQYKVLQLKKYLETHNLSPIILENTWTYLSQLWVLQRGEWIPKFILEAPGYLKQDIMYHLYGQHLESHILFEKTHKDFIRQLVTLLEPRCYLPGNVIVERGDIDGSIFFVHRGEVGAYDKHGLHEMLLFVLTGGMSFGEEEGLYDIPYKMTYKALTIVDTVSLKRNSWQYLLKWFPASAEELKHKAMECGYRG